MRAVALLLGILAALVCANTAHAHASLIRSEPPDRAVIAQGPAELRLVFNEPVSPLASRLVRPAGEATDLVGTTTADGATVVLALPPGLLSGTHLVSWRVVSADDHPVGGSVIFSIGEPSTVSPTAEAADRPLRVAIWVVRLILYAGLFVGGGGVFFLAWIASDTYGWSRAAVRSALWCGLLAAVLSPGLHGADLRGLALADALDMQIWWQGLSSAYGGTLVIAAASLVLALVALAARGGTARWLSTLALGGTGVALAASGHAATASPQVLTRTAVLVHGICVTSWLGALLPLVEALASRRDDAALRRFSRTIAVPFLAVIVSGTLLAIVQVRQVEALWTTDYGLVLCAKLVAVCLLLALAGMNRWLTPRVATGDEGARGLLRRSVVVELSIMFVVLGLVASWRFTPPPRALLDSVIPPTRVQMHSNRAMVDLQIEKATADSWRIALALQDGRHAPLAAKEVTLVLLKPDAGIEPLRLAARHRDGSTWLVDDVRLPTPAGWRARVEILIDDFERVAVEGEIDLAR